MTLYSWQSSFIVDYNIFIIQELLTCNNFIVHWSQRVLQGDQELVRRPGPWRRTHESDRRRCCGVRRSGRSCYDYVRPQPFTPAQASRGTYVRTILGRNPDTISRLQRTPEAYWPWYIGLYCCTRPHQLTKILHSRDLLTGYWLLYRITVVLNRT